MYPLAENLLWRVMSSELVAALVGAIAGGIIALFGGIAQVFIQGWISDRGRITCDLGASELSFTLTRYRRFIVDSSSIHSGFIATCYPSSSRGPTSMVIGGYRGEDHSRAEDA
jgi:hypothetical protein